MRRVVSFTLGFLGLAAGALFEDSPSALELRPAEFKALIQESNVVMADFYAVCIVAPDLYISGTEANGQAAMVVSSLRIYGVSLAPTPFFIWSQTYHGTDTRYSRHCITFAPKYEAAAKTLREQNIDVKLAKVDCTRHSIFCQEYSIRAYPTLKVFKGGQELYHEYDGPRRASA